MCGHQTLDFSKPSHQASPPPSIPPNPRLLKAYTALQAWKTTITSDPNNFTSNWFGPNVCNCRGIYCAPAPYGPHTIAVAGIYLNRANIASTLLEQLGLLADLALWPLWWCSKIGLKRGQARLVPELGDPLPLRPSRGTRLFRPKQINFLQHFMAASFVPAFSASSDRLSLALP